MARKIRVLILCTGNSCRSQMAEGFMRHYGGDLVEVSSAGLETHGLNPLAVKTMADISIDLSNHKSQKLDSFLDERFDFVITVCDHAAANCPLFPNESIRLHWPFEDPATAEGTEAEIMLVFERVRDEIARQTRAWLVEQGIVGE